MNLHEFQSKATARAVVANRNNKYHLLASPTGTGKSYMALELLHVLPDAYFITPRVEILADMVRKMGLHFATQSDLLRICDAHRMITPLRLRNRMLSGEELNIRNVLLDECFVAGTMIETPDSAIAIQDIEPGQAIVTIRADHTLGVSSVTRVVKSVAKGKLFCIDAEDSRVICTENHPFLHINGDWQAAGELCKGDELFFINSKGMLRNATVRNTLDVTTLRQELVYNLEVEADHTYFANGFAVHNCHHESSDTYQQITAMVDDDTKFTGLTATPYRGTPKGTQAFRARWGEPDWAITYPDAVEQGYLALPECKTWGLVDDDLLELNSAGEFQHTTLTAAVANNIEHALIRAIEAGMFEKGGKPVRPTIIGVPSSAVFPQLKMEAGLLGLRIATIDQSTTYAERQRLFAGVRESAFALAHINVVSEGVDLPIRQYIDLAPVMSPVAFMQRFGRATRPIVPGESRPRYICTNHNLERHGYLLDGLLPVSVFKESQSAFGKFSERSGKARAFGIQTLGKIKPATVVTSSGLRCSVYAISAMANHRKQSYLALLHPAYSSPLWFKRADTHGETIAYGKWSVEENPPQDLQGFKSLPANALSEKQLNWWNRQAKNVGLDPTQEVTPKVFQLLPALIDVGASL